MVLIRGVCALSVLIASLALADPAPRTQTVTVAPQYQAGWLHRLVLGSNYRALWTTPVSVEVLDLATEAGGLTAVRQTGSRETKGLEFKGRDGRNYRFRGIVKDVSSLVPEDMAGSVVEDIIADQMTGQHPAGELVAQGLLDAAGVPCPSWRLVVLPDDPALGEFRERFRGAVGAFAEYPSAVSETKPGFRGITEIINQGELYRRLTAGCETRIDARAFLRARLMDLMIGDWDRHERQWRWARFPGSDLWVPIPSDRDQAFSRYEGLALWFGRDRDPRFQSYEARYPGLGGLTFNGRQQDRRLLAGLTREDYTEAATSLQARLTDAAIDSAVDRMPEAWRAIDGPRLAKDLKGRRDGLRRVADRYYDYLARSVDVFMTDRSDEADLQRIPNGDLELTVRCGADSVASDAPWFHRVFHPRETREVRLYALAGDDRFTVRGGRGPITIRAVGGDGDDALDDREGGGTRFSDAQGIGALNPGPGTRVDRRPWTPSPPLEPPWLMQQRYAREGWSTPRVGYRSDLGIEAGWGYETRSYGFRKEPYASRQVFGATGSFRGSGVRLDYTGEFRRENSPLVMGLRTLVSTVEVLRFYGLANAIGTPGDHAFHKTRENQALLFPSLAWLTGPRARLVAGPLVRYAKTDDDRVSFVDTTRPYGAGRFGQAGLHGALEIDSRDRRTFPRHGVVAGARATVWPKLWDVEKAFGEINGSASTYVPMGSAVLAVRAGAKQVFGTAPFRDAATIGGGGAEPGVGFDEPSFTLRGFRARRFSGDRAAWGNADLRLELFRATILVPCHVGMFGLADAGRVWVDNERSDTWHTSLGGGVWVSPFAYRMTFHGYIAHSREGNMFHVGSGFAF